MVTIIDTTITDAYKNLLYLVMIKISRVRFILIFFPASVILRSIVTGIQSIFSPAFTIMLEYYRRTVPQLHIFFMQSQQFPLSAYFMKMKIPAWLYNIPFKGRNPRVLETP